ncbi:PAS domain S-box protein [Anabaena sp. UHCC 0204]|uniref:PAS domain S-box protein n=1 Tax=Anabaena sp. UHCC 0204 TaxID=2590009 RepID=UPI0014472F40|nr:PAS domain S-box protein [Anabaena sp. UHCC 0204]MTJ08152.1 PAS domain S-box protein [Anabaena sp. UHCC 0204]
MNTIWSDLKTWIENFCLRFPKSKFIHWLRNSYVSIDSEKRFCFLAESIPQQVWIADIEGSIEYVNERTLNYFCCTKAEILGWQWLEMVHPDDVSTTLTAWNYALVTGTNYEIEFRLYDKASQSYRWHLGRAVPWKNQQGHIINWFGTNTDIHDRLSAEISLQNSERRYKTIAAISPVGIFHTDALGNCRYVNDRWCEITGINRETALNMSWINTIHPEDRERVEAEWYHALTQKRPFRSKYRFQRSHGEVTWVLGQAVTEIDTEEKVIAHVGTITDISDSKQVEEALAERLRLADLQADIDAILTRSESLETMLRGCTDILVQHLDVAFARIWILNQKNNILELQVSSGMYTHIDGFHSRIPVGQLKVGLIAQEGKSYFTNSVPNDPQISDQEWVKREGIMAFAGYPLILDGETIGVIAIFCCQKISELIFNALAILADEIALGIQRKKTEIALKESEERFRNLVETSNDWIWEVDQNAVYTYVSPKVYNILGYEIKEMLGKITFDFMSSAQAENINNDFAEIFISPRPFQCLENLQIHKNGYQVILETSGVPIFNVAGQFCGYRGTSRDITLQKQEAAKLKETQQWLQAILDNSPTVIYVLDPENRFILVNRQFKILFNLTQEDIVGKHLDDIFPVDVVNRFAEYNFQVLSSGIPQEREEIVPLADGIHTYLSVKFPLKDVNGISYALCGISTDITERKRSEEYFRLLIESVKDYAIYMLDPQGRVMSWNSGAECITGYTASEIIGKDFSCFFPPEDILNSLPRQQLNRTAIEGRCECESIFVRKDNSEFWANCILTALYDDFGNLRGFSKVTRDITERKLAEKSLLRLQKAIESTSDAISIADISGKAIYVNPAFTEIFDYTFTELNEQGGLSANFKIQEVFQTVFSTVQKGDSWRGEVTMETRNGQAVQIHLCTDAIKDATDTIVSFVSIYTDITQRKLIEEDLRLSNRAIAANSNGIIIVDVTTAHKPIIYVNPAFEKMTGYLAADVIGQSFPLFTDIHINQSSLAQLTAAIETGQDCTVILRNSSQNGNLFWHELNISPVYDHHHLITHYIGIQTDITERKQAEIALLVSQQRLQYLLHSSPAVIYTCKAHGDYGVTFMSENVKSIMGYEASEFVAGSDFWYSHIHAEDREYVITEMSNIVQRQGEYILEYRFLHQDGVYRWVYDQGKVVLDQSANPIEIVGYWADITNRKQLEQELIVALEKEKELNELKSRFISMTSHEFRTPLSTILSSSELLEHYRHRWTEEKQLTHLRRIQMAVQRMAEMLNDVLVIGKAEVGKLEYKPIYIDLVAYCHQLLEDVKSHGNNHKIIDFNCQYQSIPCYMDEKLLSHILTNLLSNAIKYSLHADIVKFTLICQEGKVIFEIEDQGIGIPEADISRLFESFYRAGNVGNILGTGLGLAIVKKCVDIYQGEISFTSQVNVGTKFTVTLPLN